ncbi:Glyoxalase [Sinomonas atrocyanea]|uniref:Glyoxalase n=1 Tax=Sinomonas atrocyanea TaxID=37927 RepID=A0A126ZVW1_9MICC|nr:VOC family protein [Sinomonas atrocyanea]AMM31308.1 Glyoxalase [Sinomonas atrocyanea]GEB64481.1 glyoxalase [Sinomonas atrocyanea]GGG64624.1 glyoxalase [Sinomonas atrocyanea]
MDWKLELAFIPVSDVDRSIDFYVNKVGFHLDYDQRVSEDVRFVQITPPGSACSIAFGEGLSEKPPGTAALQVVVADIAAAHDGLAARVVDVSDVLVLDWGHFVTFEDPDGNRWAIQYLPQRPNG